MIGSPNATVYLLRGVGLTLLCLLACGGGFKAGLVARPGSPEVEDVNSGLPPGSPEIDTLPLDAVIGGEWGGENGP